MMSNAPTQVIAGGDDDGAKVTRNQNTYTITGDGGSRSSEYMNERNGGDPSSGPLVVRNGAGVNGSSGTNGIGGSGGYIRAEARPMPGSVPSLTSSASTATTTGAAAGGRTNGNTGSSTSKQRPTSTSSRPPSAAAAAPPQPLLPTPGAPFGGTASSSRKKAYTAAVFYGECHLAGIPAESAQDAAADITASHRRWWVDALHNNRNKNGKEKERGGRRRSSAGTGGVGGSIPSSAYDDELSSNNSSVGDHCGGVRSPRLLGNKKARQHSKSTLVSDEERADERARERRSRGGGVRDVIDRVARRQEEQGGGYISPVLTVVSPSSAGPTDESGTEDDTTDNKNSGPPLASSMEADNSNNIREMPGDGVGSLSLAPTIPVSAQRRAVEAKSALLSSLSGSGGDTTTPAFRSALHALTSYFASTGRDARRSAFTSSSRLSHAGSTSHSSRSMSAAPSAAAELSPSSRSLHPPSHGGDADLEGTWLSLSRPVYQGCLGKTDRSGHYLYTLGRMSFDMFRPTHLRCSIQGEFNAVRIADPGTDMLPEYVPRRLRREVLRCQHNGGRLRTYNIIVAFVIEPNQNRKGEEIPPDQKKQGKNEKGKGKKGGEQQHHVITRPIRGIMTNLGYMLPDPKIPNRMSIWFTEGTLEVNDEEADLVEWENIFNCHGAPKRDLRERAHVLAAKVLLGADVPDSMEVDGTLSYSLKRPIGGHGLAFCDVLYLDEDLRILRGHHGQLYVSARVLTKQSALADSTADLVGGGHAASNRDPSNGSPFQVSA